MSDEATLDDFVQENENPEKESNPDQPKFNLSRFEEYMSIIKGTKPDRVTDEKHDRSEPYLVVSTLTGEKRKYTPDTDGPKATSRDTLMIMDGSKSGRVYRGENGVIGSTMAAIRPEKTNSHYLRYFLESKFERLNSATKGSAVPHTDKDLLRSLEYPVYPLTEQQKIATVLHTVDRAIEKTETIIEQVERLEKGTIQALLSEGTYDSIAKKDTPIGEIPEHWNVRQVDDLTDVTVGYVQNIDGHFTDSNDGIRLYRTKDISSRGLQTQDKSYVTRDFHENNKGSQLIAGDLIVARHGDSGQAAVIPESTPEAHCQNVVIVRSSEEFVSKFLEYLFNYEVTRKRLLAWKAGSVQKVVSTTAVQNFRIPLPPIEEQNEIVEKLSSINDRLVTEDKYLQTLQSIKYGLQQDLLSGTVRTTDTNIEVPDEITQHG